jgi:hypothetical protein
MTDNVTPIRKAGQAPWTPDEVESLCYYQMMPDAHSYLCANKDTPAHRGQEAGLLVPTLGGWVCPFCDYRQDWAHAGHLGRTTNV